eukprot:TRINITY_DN41336_c0_g1_i1.p1 TRINITY_DN41336_c0_g1~~TRINITY_DN41336_c0_g1_i1.p1  ORF type:complete len:291 (+),score=13.64 TRINITY_DN41336_c0_g1_i1:49-921(+)
MGMQFSSIPIIISCLIHHSLPTPLRNWFLQRVPASIVSFTSTRRRNQIVASLLLAVCPPYSPASLLYPLQHVVAKWPSLLSETQCRELPDWLVGRSGPFGAGCGKACEFFCAWLLLVVWDWEVWPAALWLGPLPNLLALFGVVLLSLAVNAVLMLWSTKGNGNRGTHTGLHAMADASSGKSLSFAEHMGLGALAIGNAIFEEGVSRGFFMHELQLRGKLGSSAANFWQALSFGLWHYHGVPSGMTGVLLTFVYGGIMGMLHAYGGGMILPVVAHSLADYYIFAFLVRQQT